MAKSTNSRVKVVEQEVRQPKVRVSTEQIQVRRSEYEGREFVDIRTWYLDKDDVYRPTKKGVHVDYDQLSDIIDALKTVQAKMNK